MFHLLDVASFSLWSLTGPAPAWYGADRQPSPVVILPSMGALRVFAVVITCLPCSSFVLKTMNPRRGLSTTGRGRCCTWDLTSDPWLRPGPQKLRQGQMIQAGPATHGFSCSAPVMLTCGPNCKP